VKASGRQALPS
jgi:hypothetical protein